MVQQATAPEAPQAPAPPESPDQAFEILDETSPAQLATEARVMAGETVEEAPVRTVEEAEAPVEAPAASAAPPPATPTPTPPPRTYTEAEVEVERRRLQSIKDREVAQIRQQAAQAEVALVRQALDGQVERHLRAQEQQLEATLGADEARKQVRSPANQQYVRDHYAAQLSLQVAEQERSHIGMESEAQAVVMTARYLAQQHGVAREDMETLIYAPTPQAMERLAQRLGKARAASGQSVAEQRSRVPAETDKTKLDTGMPSATAPESADVRSRRLNATEAADWTESDWKFMRTGR